MTHEDDVPSLTGVFIEFLRVIIRAFLRLLAAFAVFTIAGHVFLALFIGMSSRFIFFRKGVEMPVWWTPVHEALVGFGYFAMPVLFPTIVILAALFIFAVEWFSAAFWRILTWPL